LKAEKKAKKAAKRKAEAEPEVEEQPQQVAAAAAAEPEEDDAAAAKRARKEAKRAKKEKAAAGADSSAAAAASSTSSALASLADERPAEKEGDAEEEEVFDLASLKKGGGQKVKVAVHSSRVNASGEVDGSASGSFVPDANAVVIAEPVRIFLGNLPFKITDALVHECFDEFGEIEGIHWVTDKQTGQFYGSGFVDFKEASSAKAALVRNGVEILGRPIKVGMATGANVAGKNRFNSKEKNGAHLAKIPVSAKPDQCNTVFLGNLSFHIDEQTLREHFKDCGEITDIRWVEKDGEFKGCGFIEFAESWSTDEAVKFNGADIMGRPVRVDYSARGSR
jgi:nucleolin